MKGAFAMNFYLILILILFACSPLLLLHIFYPRPQVNSYIVSNMKNRNHSKPIGEQFEGLEKRFDNIEIDFTGYFDQGD
jgi:hypothetical protein